MKTLSVGFDPAAPSSRANLHAVLRSIGMLAYVTLVVTMAIGAAVMIDLHLSR